jgi:hypothetical protein
MRHFSGYRAELRSSKVAFSSNWAHSHANGRLESNVREARHVRALREVGNSHLHRRPVSTQSDAASGQDYPDYRVFELWQARAACVICKVVILSAAVVHLQAWSALQQYALSAEDYSAHHGASSTAGSLD